MTGFDHEFIDPFELSPTLFYSDMESGNFFLTSQTGMLDHASIDR